MDNNNNRTRVIIGTRIVTQPDWVAEVAAQLHDPLSRVVYRDDPLEYIKEYEPGSSDPDLQELYAEDNIALKRPARKPACECCINFIQKVKDVLGPRIMDEGSITRCGTHWPWAPVPVDLTNKKHVEAEVWLDEDEVKIYDDFLRRTEIRDYGESDCLKKEQYKNVEQLRAVCRKLKILKSGYTRLKRHDLIDLINWKNMVPTL